MPKRFLVIQTAFLGDAVLATALLEKLHAFYPDAAIDLVVRKGNEGLFTPSGSPGVGGKCAITHTHPFLRKLFVWDKRTDKTRNLFKLIGELRRERYDHVINCQRFFSTGLMTVLARGGEKIGYDKNPLSFLFTRKVEHVIGDGRHEVDRLNALIEHLTDGTRPFPRLHPSYEDLNRVRSHVDWEKDYYCIVPASVWFTKQWPESKWVELIKSLPPAPIFLLGSQDDRQLCARIISAAGRGTRLAGRLTLLETTALMRDATMNYVNDSAGMHMASSLNARVTAIFCSTVPAFGFGPLSTNGRVVETMEKLDCRPCGLHGHKSCPKGHFKCALGISVPQVVAT